MSFSQECRRHDCQKSSELSSAESRHDLEVRSWISRVQRLSACAQGAKSSDSKASMSAFARLHQEGDAWQCGAVRAGAPAAASMCKEGARARAGTPSLLLTAARVSSITRHRAAVLRVMQGEARAARAGEAFCACRALLRCVPSARRQCWAYILQVHGKTGWLLRVAVCPFRSRKKFAFGSAICQLYFFYSRLLISC